MRMTKATWQPGEPRDLGAGLRLRWSSVEDTEGIAQLVGQVFRENEEAPLRESFARWMRELMSGEHPLMGAGDFALVEDMQAEKPRLVATTCYWHHVWEYEGIELRMGRPEVVATDPAYRQRGLVRALFEEVHARSEAEGDLLQAITGIPYFYRQFGYEYALSLTSKCVVPLSHIPALREGVPEPYQLRDATLEDIPSLQAFYRHATRGQMVVTRVEDEWWRYQLSHRQTSQSDEHWHVRLIVDRAERPWGHVVTPVVRSRNALPVWHVAFDPGAPLLTLIPSLLRALRAVGQQMTASPGASKLTEITFYQGPQQPFYQILDGLFQPRHERPYAWYVRVPNLARFLWRIAPALEQRLANSPLVGYTGGLKLDLYRSGLRMVWRSGQLLSAEDWERSAWPDSADASFPPLVFLQLLFGHRSLDELSYAFPDVEAKEEAALVLKTLFPARPSAVVSLG